MKPYLEVIKTGELFEIKDIDWDRGIYKLKNGKEIKESNCKRIAGDYTSNEWVLTFKDE